MAPPSSRGRMAAATIASASDGSSLRRMKVSTNHLWAVSRPVSITPRSRTESPTRRDWIASGVSGSVSVCTASSSRVLDRLAANRHAAPAVGPAHIGHGNEVTGRQAVEFGRLDAQHGGLASEAHWPDAEGVGLLQQASLESSKVFVFVSLVR